MSVAKKLPLVAIIGRPNVGKSTLFNRLIEERQAIVHDEPGVTRDRVYGTVDWNGKTFALTDTGGYVPHSSDRFEAAIREQVDLAIEEADVLLFTVDATTGITDLDEELAEKLRRTSKPVLVVANKADNEVRRLEAQQFYAFGLGEVYPISAISGSGTGDMLDAVLEQLPTLPEEMEEDEAIRIAIVGRPNVGKSSLTNALIGKERSIVTEISGTTRDAIDTRITYEGENIVLIDTAGLRKKSRIRENVEFYATLRTQRAIQRSDIVVLVLDAERGLESQDIKVLKQAERMKKGMVIVVNKWDLIDKTTDTADRYRKAIYGRLGTLTYIPILFVSALTGKRVPRVLDAALAVARERQKRIPTSRLNEVLLQAIQTNHPPAYRGKHVKIKYVSQVKANPPVFAYFVNHPRGIKEPYRRYLERHIREHFGFEGVPLTQVFKEK